MLKPIVKPIPFTGVVLKQDTIREFKITKQENEFFLGLKLNKHDHVQQNVQLASKYNEMKCT